MIPTSQYPDFVIKDLVERVDHTGGKTEIIQFPASFGTEGFHQLEYL